MDVDRWGSFDVSALYYDVLRAGQHQCEVAPHVVRDGDVVIDLGAGSGRVAADLAGTASAVFALEPNRTMRALMLSHLSRHPEALAAVTVLPLGAEDDWGEFASVLPRPATVDVVLMLGVVHMLEPARRRAAFSNVTRWLSSEGLLVVTGVADSAEPIDVSLGRVTIGALTLEGRLRTQQHAGGWRTVVDYVTRLGDEEFQSDQVAYRSFAPDRSTVEHELGDVGLDVAWTGILDAHPTLVASRGRPWRPAV